MASPLTGSDFDAAVAGPFANICAGFKSLFLLGPMIAQWFHWAFTDDGEASDDFKALFVSIGVPVGSLLDWPLGGSIPEGYLEANGQTVSRTVYAGLFAVYGTSFGAGDGTTTFQLPNCGGRFRMGRDASNSAGTTGGAATVQLTASQNGQHSHTTYVNGQGTAAINKIWGSTLIPGGPGALYGNHGLASVGTQEAPFETIISDSGTGAAHENLPPYVVATVIIKT